MQTRQTRLWLVSHAATAAMRSGRFPADDPLDARGHTDAHAYRAQLEVPGDALVFSSPARCARETATALNLTADIAPALADMHYGRWHGQRVADIATDELPMLSAWSTDPTAAPPGGESFAAVSTRVAQWLDQLADVPAVIAITHAVVIRAALLHALRAPLATYTRIEIAPLSRIELQRSTRGWVWWPAA
ncbi:histidine phosphatase family protein [Paraburkholderia acidicola]|uniref:Histidine phosphatase family protein n=1 Tax=Paraburkholderia acidicola TaxID=1912599 RepID=A0A2A4F0S5_9BURK|nr:histidine phosphatase family protein [Paraburkholderia acidicola]PCE27463.1 histidine phosphatase family protein [Paraburkholderia acidicola]